MNKLSQKVLEKIKEEKIEPKPRWHFLLKDYVVWTALLVSVLIGSLAFCVIITLFYDNDWDIYKYLGVNPFRHIVLSLPYFWILSVGLFSALAYYNYRHTKSGYCCKARTIVAGSIAASLILGYVFHLAGLGRRIDHALSQNFPLYASVHCCCHREDIWSQPEKGLLGGKYLSEESLEIFLLEDFGGEIWQVEKDKNIVIRRSLPMHRLEFIKMIGEKKKERLFHALEIRPW